LGCIALWKDFPLRLARATGREIVVYSRQGYGRSSALKAPRTVRYMHDEALIVLPELLKRWNIDKPILFGHSDGASIALIHAGAGTHPVAGLIVLAPHVLVEDISVSSIEAARKMYRYQNMRDRLAPYHEDVDGAFWGWNDIWLHPDFRSWNIEEYLPGIQCKTLAVQGQDDEYGTMQQIERIAAAAHDVQMLKLDNCRHSPHRDQPQAVLDAVTNWIGKSCA
jgi:pimeloyl-ACP methyl ester carboxylesterase